GARAGAASAGGGGCAAPLGAGCRGGESGGGRTSRARQEPPVDAGAAGVQQPLRVRARRVRLQPHRRGNVRRRGVVRGAIRGRD
ncbi:hypothetical protein T484DRAFT_1877346, partial [Baffinella frigidus]